MPTAAEAGLPGLEVDTWYALYAPAGTPREIVDLLAARSRKSPSATSSRRASTRPARRCRTWVPTNSAKYTAGQVTRWTGIIDKLNIPKQ